MEMTQGVRARCFLSLRNRKHKDASAALIEATEWHAQSNWISSAVSSNLIWPALWRMTGERNTPPHPPTPSPRGVPPAQSNRQTCSFRKTTGQHLLRRLPAAEYSVADPSAPSGNPTAPLCPPHLTYPKPPWPFLAFLTPQLAPPDTQRSGQSIKGGVEAMEMLGWYQKQNILLIKEPF